MNKLSKPNIMAFEKKPLQDGVKIELKDYSVDLEDRIDSEMTKINNQIGTDGGRIYLDGGVNAYKKNNVVTVYAYYNGTALEGGDYVHITTLPEGYRPLYDTIWGTMFAFGGDTSRDGVRIDTDGKVEIYLRNTRGTYGFTITYGV